MDSLIKQRDFLINKLNEMSITISSLENLKDGENLVHFGSRIFLKGSFKRSEKVLIEIGSNIAIEKSLEDAVDFLKSRIKENESFLELIEKEIENTSIKIQKIAPKIKQLLEGKGNV